MSASDFPKYANKYRDLVFSLSKSNKQDVITCFFKELRGKLSSSNEDLFLVYQLYIIMQYIASDPLNCVNDMIIDEELTNNMKTVLQLDHKGEHTISSLITTYIGVAQIMANNNYSDSESDDMPVCNYASQQYVVVIIASEFVTFIRKYKSKSDLNGEYKAFTSVYPGIDAPDFGKLFIEWVHFIHRNININYLIELFISVLWDMNQYDEKDEEKKKIWSRGSLIDSSKWFDYIIKLDGTDFSARVLTELTKQWDLNLVENSITYNVFHFILNNIILPHQSERVPMLQASFKRCHKELLFYYKQLSETAFWLSKRTFRTQSFNISMLVFDKTCREKILAILNPRHKFKMTKIIFKKFFDNKKKIKFISTYFILISNESIEYMINELPEK